MTHASLDEVYRDFLVHVAPRYRDIILRIETFYRGGVLVKFRVVFVDGSYLDVWWSPQGRYSYHWERRHIDGKIFRHDNSPHKKWSYVRTFPKHFHNGSEDNVIESTISDDPLLALQQFLDFIQRCIGI